MAITQYKGTGARTRSTLKQLYNLLSAISSAEVSVLDGVTAGTVTASKAVVAGANKNLDELHLAKLYLGAGAGTEMTATSAQLNALVGNMAGLAPLIAAGLGASDAYDNATDGAQTLIAANESGDGARVVLGIVIVDEAFADNTEGTQTVFIIGETGSTNKFMANTVLVDAAAGDIFLFAGVLSEEAALLVTGTPAGTVGTGGISVTALVLPAAVPQP